MGGLVLDCDFLHLSGIFSSCTHTNEFPDSIHQQVVIFANYKIQLKTEPL
jgi:hypothetical protein